MGTSSSAVSQHEQSDGETAELDEEPLNHVVMEDSTEHSDQRSDAVDDDADWIKVEREDALPAVAISEATPLASLKPDHPGQRLNACLVIRSTDGSFDEVDFLDCPVGVFEDTVGVPPLACVLDEEAFPCFAPLIAASQDYASQSGCRFRGDDFPDAATAEEVVATGAITLEAASLQSHATKLAPIVADFTARLMVREPGLVEEMDCAYDIVMMESVRNAMVAAFREVDLWPPSPSPPGIAEDDWNFEDLSAPIPAIAQRAFNDEARRNRDAAGGGGAGFGNLFRKATTASYLVDFAYEVGAQLPTGSSDSRHVAMLQEFGERLEKWQNERDIARAAGTFFPVTSSDSLVVAKAPVDDFETEAARWLSEHWREALWTFTGTILISAAASASFSLFRRSVWNEAKMRHALAENAFEEAACTKDNVKSLVKLMFKDEQYHTSVEEVD
jgi:hypothetical protein